jgi:aconitate hydratase
MLLKGKQVHPDVSLVISPGSRQVLTMLARDGGLADMIEAGARILEVACGPCIGMGQAPPSGGVSVHTFNRNFPGRSGTPDAQVYLCGPQTAVAAALKGCLTDPRQMGDPPVVEEPEAFLVDDSMILAPPDDGREITVRLGPNIKPLPALDPLPDEMHLDILLKVGDHITTDDILPGGAKVLPLRSNLSAISEHVYALKSPGFAARAKQHEAVAILGGENYGQGSSREHAALAPRYLGVRAVLARSFARLHRANLINFGVAPLLITAETCEQLEEGDRIRLPGLREFIEQSDQLDVIKDKNGYSFKAGLKLSARERSILLDGGCLNFERGRAPQRKHVGRPEARRG